MGSAGTIGIAAGGLILDTYFFFGLSAIKNKTKP